MEEVKANAGAGEVAPGRKSTRFDPETRMGKFVREVGSVVLGVLIALLIGEIANYVRMRIWAAQTTQAITSELARNAGVFDERQLLQPCVERRIVALMGVVREARRTGTLPEVGPVGQTPFRSVEKAVWQLASSSDVMLYLDRELRTSLAMTYPLIEEYTASVEAEQELWASLRVMQRAPGKIPDDMMVQIATDVELLDHRARLNGIKGAQILAAIQHLKIPNDYSSAFSHSTRRNEVVADLKSRPLCQPLLVDGKPYVWKPN